MIVKDPMGSGEVSGTSLASTFKNNRGVRVLQGRPCSNPRDTAVRRLANALMAAANHAWIALSESDRSLWRASSGPGTHGQAEFVGRYCRVHRVLPAAANPVLGFRPAPPLIELTVDRFGGEYPEIDLSWYDDGSPSWYVEVWGQVLASAGRQADATRWKLWGWAGYLTGSLGIVPDPYPGMLIVVQVRLVDCLHGQGSWAWQGAPQEYDAYVLGPHAPLPEPEPVVPVVP
jgi:hypothetical protein